MVGTILVIAGLLAMGAIVGGYIVWRQYRYHPTNDTLRFANAIYQRKSDDYKALCKDSLRQAEALALLAQTIHVNNPSEASEKIVDALDRFIVVLNERSAAKQFTPPGGVTLP